jgi:hypothetical protein
MMTQRDGLKASGPSPRVCWDQHKEIPFMYIVVFERHEIDVGRCLDFDVVGFGSFLCRHELRVGRLIVTARHRGLSAYTSVASRDR